MFFLLRIFYYGEFFWAGKSFEFSFFASGFGKSFAGFRINQCNWAADFGVVGSGFEVVVGVDSFFEIVGAADVEGAIGAFEDVDEESHLEIGVTYLVKYLILVSLKRGWFVRSCAGCKKLKNYEYILRIDLTQLLKYFIKYDTIGLSPL